MTRFTQLLGTMLLSTMVWAGPQDAPESNKERQPGVLRISGAADKDQVMLDGEFMGDGRRIAQFGSKLLVSPGEYTITIISPETGRTCQSKIRVPENGSAVARCGEATSEYDQIF